MDWYYVLRVIFRLVFKLAAKLEITGWEYVPQKGPFILAVNHLSLIDTPVLFIVMPHHITAFAADKWGRAFFIGWLLRRANAIFVNREQIDRRALQEAVKVLKNGGVLGLAPEGTRSRNGAMNQAKPGIAYLASKTDVPVLPVGLSGTLGMARHLTRFKRLPVQVKFGPLVHLPPLTGSDKTAQLQAYADQVMVAIARLIPPELRGVYATAVQSGTE